MQRRHRKINDLRRVPWEVLPAKLQSKQEHENGWSEEHKSNEVDVVVQPRKQRKGLWLHGLFRDTEKEGSEGSETPSWQIYVETYSLIY